MIHLTRTEDEIEALRYEHFHHPHPRVQMTMAAVPLTALGLSRSVVARVAGCSETTVRTYLKAYQGGGIEALKHFSVGGSTSDLEAHRGSLREEFDQRPRGVCTKPSIGSVGSTGCNAARVKCGHTSNV